MRQLNLALSSWVQKWGQQITNGNWPWRCRYYLKSDLLTCFSGGSRSSNKWGGASHPDPEIRGGGGGPPKKIFSALRASVWSKHKGVGGPLRAPPLDPPLCLHNCTLEDVETYWFFFNEWYSLTLQLYYLNCLSARL